MKKILYYGGRVLTIDPDKPEASAVVVEGDRITYVGREEEARRRAGNNAETVDLAGDVLIPGFNDNHIHTVFTGFRETSLNLDGLDAAGIVNALKAFYPNPKKGQLLDGYGWDYTACPKPHRNILDTYFPDNPVVLAQYGGHAQWLNSKGLSYMGVRSDSPDPPEGEILRDENGEPTGVVRELKPPPRYALRFFRQMLNKSFIRDAVGAALLLYRKTGITSVQDNTWIPRHVGILRRLAARDDLTCRFSCWHWGQVPPLNMAMNWRKFTPPLIRRGPEKYFLDGTFTTRTAWLSDPYHDEPENSGKGKNRDAILALLRPVAKRGHQGAFHAIGDMAIKNFLDAVEELYREVPEARNLRFRLEHAQLIRDEDIPRLRDLNVLICAQPHAMATPEKDAALLGKERAGRAYPYRKLLDAGVHLSFGSDYPGEGSFAPLRGIRLAVDRPPELAITPAEALACYTRGGAFAEFMENEKGMIKEGYLADMVRLDGDPETVKPAEIENIGIVETVMAGKTVFRRAKS